MRRSLLLCLAALACAGCETSLVATSAAPAAKAGAIDPIYKSIELSAGVALALACTYHLQPCEDTTAATTDESLAEVRPAILHELSDEDAIPPTTFVLFAKAPGETTMRIEGTVADADYTVTITQ